jgi:DNA-binding NtrC family response regulator
MPGKSGLELARELTLIRPTLPVLIVSGSQISSDMAFEMESRNWKFLPKPCGLPLILSTLESLLRQDVRQAA